MALGSSRGAAGSKLNMGCCLMVSLRMAWNSSKVLNSIHAPTCAQRCHFMLKINLRLQFLADRAQQYEIHARFCSKPDYHRAADKGPWPLGKMDLVRRTSTVMRR